MKIPWFLKSLWEKIKKQSREEHQRTDDPQIIPAHLSAHSYGAIQHHPTTDEIQHRTAERYYWQEQRRLTKELNDLTRRLNRITGWGTGVALLGLIALVCTLSETRKATRIAAEALILDQRPWVFSKNPMLVSLQPHVPITTFIDFVNTGRSPAFIIESSVALRTVDSSGLPVIPEYGAPEPQNYVLSPVVPHQYRHITDKGLAPQNVTAVNKGVFQLYIYGYVRYRDSRGDTHKTGFIVLYNPKRQTLDHSPQPNYTYAD